MVRNHVAQRARLFVVTRATADTRSFSRGDLDVVDVVAVPDRLKHRVAETEDEYVLNGVFAEVMIDAIDLVLGEHFRDLRVQRARGFEIAAEGFLDNDAAPVLVVLLVQA